MRSVSFLSLVLVTLMGCAIPSLNSPPTKAHACSEQKKCCGCPGKMECCSKNADGSLCCKPDDCTCNQVTTTTGCGSCAK